ncbi:MAG: hypothetical protein ABEH38_07010 [Flavobacteriales bacterium]
MRRRSSFLTWTVVFALIFALSLDYWRWGEPVSLTFLNFPAYLLHFIILQLVFAGAVFLFIKSFWNGKGKD